MPVRTVFFGSAPLSAACLERLLADSRFEVAAVVCQPDNPRAKKNAAGPVKALAVGRGILCLQPEKVGATTEQIAALAPDIGALAAYGQFIPERLIGAFPHGILNVHPSLLPKYRGAAPIQHAIWNGESRTGITIMRIVKKMDAGPWCAQTELTVPKGATYGELMDDVVRVAPGMFADSLYAVASGKKVSWTEQDESAVSFAPLLTREQERIDWRSGPSAVVRHIRAFSPEPGAYALRAGDERIKIFNAEVGDCAKKTPPGTVNAIAEKYFCVQAGGNDGICGCVHVSRFLLPGKRAVDAASHRGAYPFAPGDRFIVADGDK